MSTSKLFEKEQKKTTNINLHVVDLGGGAQNKKTCIQPRLAFFEYASLL